MKKNWFVTGASRGFGRVFAESALSRGDRVAATARDVDDLADLVGRYGDKVLPLALDVTEKAAVTESVDRSVDHFGRLDVIVNNAGYGLFGMVEELSEKDVRAQMEVNVFGPLWVTQAALPHLRRQRAGHIVQISSFNGIATFPMMGAYSASKWALEALSDSLAQEVAGFGIKVTLVEPAQYSTDFGGSSAAHSTSIDAYDGVRASFFEALGKVKSIDPKYVGPALLKITDVENPPLRVIFGRFAFHGAQDIYAERVKGWNEWSHLSDETDGPSA